MQLSELVDILQPVTLHQYQDKHIDGIDCRPQTQQHNILYAVIDEFLEYGQWAQGASLDIPYSNIAALLVEHPIANINLPQIQVKDSRKALALAAQNFYQAPDQQLKIIGITGTNGKTTTAHLINQWLNLHQMNAAALGTLGLHQMQQKIADPGYTTPLSSDLFALLATLPSKNISHLAMEISSHALKLDRTFNLDIDVAIFTNLTRDHLDFHTTLANYKTCKQKLFKHLKANSTAIINQDDPLGQQIIQKHPSPIISYGCTPDAMLYADHISSNLDGNHFQCHYQQQSVPFKVPLLGQFNIYNILSAIATALTQGIDLQQLQQTAQQLRGVPGRMESFNLNNGCCGIVDYAHTPDALEKALQTIRSLNPRKVISIFGCGGDRDKGKRPLMGKIAAHYSDHVIVTTDNPRREDPQNIINDILKGMPQQNKSVITDRYQAIQQGYSLTYANDVLLVAGKGHESYQIIGDVKTEFSDRIELAKLIQPLAGAL